MLRFALVAIALIALAPSAQSQQRPADRGTSRSVSSDTPRRADLVTADDTRTILQLARELGSADLEKGDRGDPIINGQINGLRYSVLFSACSSGRDCKYIQMIASFELPKGFSDQDMNTWNKTRLFGKAFINDKGVAVISLNTTLVGGVSRANMTDVFSQFKIFLVQFNDFLYGKRR